MINSQIPMLSQTKTRYKFRFDFYGKMGDITKKRPAGRAAGEECAFIKKRIKNPGLVKIIIALILSVSGWGSAFASSSQGGQDVAQRPAETNDGFRLDKALLNLIPKSPPNSAFTTYWENDGTFLKPLGRTDRHYTEGLKFTYTHQPEWSVLKEFGRWNNFGDDDANIATAMGYFFGQNMYTPDHADDPSERNGPDRVFAAWMYGGIFAQRATKDEMEHFELNLGIIGPSALGGEVQTFIHRLVQQDEPNGWDNQLGNEFAIDVSWLKRQKADGLLFRDAPNFDTHFEYGFTAGSVFRNAKVGAIFRWGDNLPNDFGPGRLEAPACATGRISDEQTYLYLFSRLSCKLVQYDRFLTGLDTEPVVGQFQLGLVWRYKSFQVSYSQTFLTHDYKEQPEVDSFAALNLSYYF